MGSDARAAAGTLAFVTDAREPLFSSSLLLDQIEVMRELYGDHHVNGAIAALPSDARRELEELTQGAWCKVALSAAVKKELARRVGEGPLTLQRRVVEHGTERSLNGIWRFFLSRLSDPWLMKFSPLVYSKAFDYGALVVEQIVPGRADVVVRGWPDMPDFDCVGIAAAIEMILTLARRDRPKLTWMRRGGEVRFAAVWNQAAVAKAK
jgi:hypothetical protein